MRDLLERLAPPEDVALLVDSGVRLSDLARPGFVGEAALLPLTPETRRRLEAAFELARRRFREPPAERVVLTGAGDVYRIVEPWFRDESVEVFRVLLLDARNGLLAMPEVSRGTLSTSLVHPREVFRQALLAQAAAVIVTHNHPSGVADPSPQDDEVTDRLARAGRLLGVPLVDHVVVGEGNYHSYREAGHVSLAGLAGGRRGAGS